MSAAIRLMILLCLITTPGIGVAAGQSLPTATPESVGMSTERLARLTRVWTSTRRRGSSPER